MKRFLIVLAMAVALAGCDDTVTDPAEGVDFLVEVVPGETFRIRLTQATQIAEARALLASGEATVVHGEIVRGNGGFNAGFSWHLKPSSVNFVDIAMELCDGRPSYLEAELDYYLESVKFYCPWGATIVDEDR